MNTPGASAVRKVFPHLFSAAYAAASLNRVALEIVGVAILVVAMILPAGAAPQANSQYALSGRAAEPPGWQPADHTGGGFAPETQLGTLSVTPTSVAFSSVPVGLTNSQSVSLTNTGSANVQVSRAYVAGGSFKITGLAASTTIAPGQSVTFSISFRPSSTATFAATGTINSNASNSPLAIPLSGTGSASSAIVGTSPASLGFGNVTLGTSSTLNVSLTNSGNVNITIYKATVPSGVFTTSGVSAGLILGPAQTATLNVTYSPTSACNSSGNISISTSASAAAVRIPVSGSGQQGAAASVALNWVASSSPGVVGYDVYRSTVSGGAYTVLNSSAVASTQFTDASVAAGQMYYYVVTSVDSSNMQSGFSTEVSANVPAE